MHGRLPILGYRIGQLGYITDMLTMPEESYEQLAGIDVLVVNALRIATHPTHQNLEEALAVAQRIQAKKTYFIHMIWACMRRLKRAFRKIFTWHSTDWISIFDYR